MKEEKQEFVLNVKPFGVFYVIFAVNDTTANICD